MQDKRETKNKNRKLIVSRLIEKKIVSKAVKKYGPYLKPLIKIVAREAIKGTIKYYIEKELNK